MMNVVAPSQECSSGCESGWTLYLEQSNYNPNTFSNGFRSKNTSSKKNQKNFEDQDYNKNSYLTNEQEEDLSMVSDASSGPPHFDHDNTINYYEETLCYNNINININNEGLRKPYGYKTQSCNNINNSKIDDFGLDDTASSHVFASKKIVGSNIHVQNNQGASFDRFIDYSSHAYSATHFQIGLNDKKSRR